ncbi:5952_t:CDS:2 [Ambispora leptoticha]|uniref:5952_t:CDS:1 n=1 Tax=Ambispora leptoticha TaxID=144679 RepID=A0A9N8ZS49_9GLOM|nr:5952_t:CDS:2 [Ambispora leptoticha]
MHALHIFTLAIAVFLIVDALPYEQSKVYTIPLKKKTITRRRALRRDVGNVEVSQQPPDIAYFGEVTFGDTQTFDIQFDTGSADFFVTSIDCNSPACEVKNKYDPNEDASFVDIDKTFSVDYDRGSASGQTSGTTSIKIGDFTVEAQEFGLADTLSDDFTRDEYDGIMGMALSSASENGQLTPITNLINNNNLDQPQFAFKLGRDADGTESELTIGGINQARLNGQLTWSNLADNNRGHWLIPLDDCFVDGQALNFQGRNANIDTGTTLMIVPIADARQIYAQITEAEEQDNGRFSLPCENENIIGLRINGVTWNMDFRDFVTEDGDECFGAIEGDDTGSDTEWVVGAAFLKNVYSVFDQGNLQVGFGQLA